MSHREQLPRAINATGGPEEDRMAHVAPDEYAKRGRDFHESSYPRDFQLEYHGRPLDFSPVYGRPSPPGMSNGRPVYPPSQGAEDVALAERMAAMELAQPGRPWPSVPPRRDLVVHVIEAAESAIRDQASALRDKIEENERLRSALWTIEQGMVSRQVENQFREDYKPVQVSQSIRPPLSLERHGQMVQGTDYAFSNRNFSGDGLSGDPQSSLIVHPNPHQQGRHFPNGISTHHYGHNNIINGALRDGGSYSQISSPSSRSVSPSRHHRETEPEIRIQSGSQGLTKHLPEANASSDLWKQELVIKGSKSQEEIKQLRKYLSDAAVQEMQLVQEKYSLEKRLSDLRVTIDRYQQELLEAASKVIPIRHEVLEENARLTYDLQVYATSLLPMLAEFNLRPAATDVHSIVRDVKAVVNHLRDMVGFIEDKHKDLSHPRQLWPNDPTYQSFPRFPPPSPIHPRGPFERTSETHGLEIVPQQPYSKTEMPASPMSPLNPTIGDWDTGQGVTSQRPTFRTDDQIDLGSDHVRRSPYHGQTTEPLSSTSPRVNHSFDADTTGHQHVNDVEEERITATRSPRSEHREKVETGMRSPQLPTLPEEPTSSASEDEDPLPAIDGLSINGEAVLGNKIGAVGFSINGTTLCHFQWVRHYRDGVFTYIPGAGQPDYTITADDVDTMIILECTPMDDRNRKGAMVRAFANNQNWITLEPALEEQIAEYITTGQAIFDLKLVGGSFSDNAYEPAVLTLKRSSYELKRLNPRKVFVHEKYASESEAEVHIPQGNLPQFLLQSSSVQLSLELEDNRARDLVVLTMREFIRTAADRKRARKRLWLTKK